MNKEEMIFDEKSEEYKAIKWLENKTTNYSDESLVLHYNNILYYLIDNLIQENKQLKERIDKAIEYIEMFYDRNQEIIDEFSFEYSYKHILEILKGDDK